MHIFRFVILNSSGSSNILDLLPKSDIKEQTPWGQSVVIPYFDNYCHIVGIENGKTF